MKNFNNCYTNINNDSIFGNGTDELYGRYYGDGYGDGHYYGNSIKGGTGAGHSNGSCEYPHCLIQYWK